MVARLKCRQIMPRQHLYFYFAIIARRDKAEFFIVGTRDARAWGLLTSIITITTNKMELRGKMFTYRYWLEERSGMKAVVSTGDDE